MNTIQLNSVELKLYEQLSNGRQVVSTNIIRPNRGEIVFVFVFV